MSILGLYGRGTGQEITNYRFNRYMQGVINPTLDADALDSSQSWILDVLETETEWRAFYTGANTQPIVYLDGNTYDNTDSTYLAIKTKSNDVLTGWNKLLDINGNPKPVFKPSFVDGQFDKFQIWMRSVMYEGGVLKGWFVGDRGVGTDSYKVGYATSNDLGETWTKLGTTPIYEDLLSGEGGRGIVVLRVVKDATNYKMIYCGIDPNTRGLFIAQSNDGINGWTLLHSNLFENQELGFPADFRYVNGTYYLWNSRYNLMQEGNLGPCQEIILFSSTDLVNWTNLGVQMKWKGSQECGIGTQVRALQKPNGEWFMLVLWYINRTQALDVGSNTKEPSVGTKIAQSNNTTSFVMNSECTYQYPSYVTFHAPLGMSEGLTEVITNISGTINGTRQYTERDYLVMSGSQTLTFANNGSVINGGNFGVKMRVQKKLTATNELFRIGNDILVTIETGKLRVRLSSNGSAYQKDYITTVNLSFPVGMDYFDDHLYIQFHWNGTSLRMWNDFVEFTSGEITKTVDNALTTVNNSGSNILIGQNTAIELRSVSIMNGTPTELIELDI